MTVEARVDVRPGFDTKPSLDKFESGAKSLATFAAAQRGDQLPPEVSERAKDLLLDTVGITIHGATAPWARSTQTTAKAESGPCSVFGTPLSSSAIMAALANGVAAHAYDFDDVHNGSITHPAAAVIPAALAVAQETHADGKVVLAALVAGYEMVARVGTALVPLRHRARGFHPTGTCGPFGAAVATGLILGLDAPRLTWALGIAGSTASGLMEYWQAGTMTKRLHPGLAALHGILAARLAQNGLTGPETVFEGTSGIFRAYTDDPEPETLVEGLGLGYAIMDSQIKLYACRSGLHTSLEALLQLRAAHDIDPDAIAGITVRHVRKDRVSDHSHAPTNTLEAQMSLPFTIAAAAYGGVAGPADYSAEKLSDSRILDLARRVESVFDEELYAVFVRDPLALPSAVEVTMKDGTRYRTRIDYPPDGPGNRSDRSAIVRKFHGLVEPIFGERRTEALVNAIYDIDRCDDVNELCRQLHGPAQEI